MKRHLLTIPLLLLSITAGALNVAPSEVAPLPKPGSVEVIFPKMLETNNINDRELLLAIAIERTAPNTAFYGERVGVPYIVNDGEDHWKKMLGIFPNKIDSVVNNGLLLLFGDNKDLPEHREMATLLIAKAAEQGYWPAQYFVANEIIQKVYKASSTSLIGYSGMSAQDVKSQTRVATSLLYECATAGFALCQLKFGLWLHSQDSNNNMGYQYLEEGLKRISRDARYAGYATEVVSESIRLMSGRQ